MGVETESRQPSSTLSVANFSFSVFQFFSCCCSCLMCCCGAMPDTQTDRLSLSLSLSPSFRKSLRNFWQPSRQHKRLHSSFFPFEPIHFYSVAACKRILISTNPSFCLQVIPLCVYIYTHTHNYPPLLETVFAKKRKKERKHKSRILQYIVSRQSENCFSI